MARPRAQFPVGVIATVGEDPGWSPEERRNRRDLHRQRGALKALLQQRQAIVSKSAAIKDEGTLARLQVRARQAEEQIERAEARVRELELSLAKLVH